MADLTAHFGADFGKFHDAVAGAEKVLVDFEKGSTKVEATLGRMTDAFSGRRMIQEADLMTQAVADLGGASKLTEAELARVSATVGEAVTKMDRMGMNVPDNMRALAAETKGAGKEMGVLGTLTSELGGMVAAAFSVQAIVNFTLEAIHATAAIQKIATQTGMTTDEVQKLQYAAGQVSVDFATVVSASQGLEAALGDPGGNKGVIGALRALGIDMDAFMGKDAGAHILEISDKLKGMTSQTEYAAAARDIFGNKWKEMTPLLLADLQQLGSEATKSSKETIASIDAMEAQWAGFKQDFTAVVAGTVMGFGQMVTAGKNWVTEHSAILAAYNLLRAATTDTSDAASGLEGALARAQANLPPVGKAAKEAGVDLMEMSEAEKALDKELEASFKARAKKEADELAAATKKAAEETAEWVKVFREVEAAADDWHATLAQLDPALVAHIQTQLRAGESADKLAKAFGLTSQQIKAVAIDLKTTDEAFAESARLSTQLATLVTQNTGTALEASVAAINRDTELYRQSLEKKGIWDADFAAKSDALRKARIERETVDWKVIGDASKDSLQDTATKAEATYQYMLAHSEKFKMSAVQDQRDVAEAARIAADSWEQSFTEAGDRVITVGDSVAEHHKAAAQSVALSWSQAMSAVAAGQGAMSGSTNAFAGSRGQVQKAFDEHRYYGPVAPGGFGGVHPDWEALGFSPTGSADDMPHRAAGGPVSAGNPYMVGERGPEMFVPDRGGTVVPNGAGASVVANIYVNGTGADVARIINAELTRMMRVGRKWPSV